MPKGSCLCGAVSFEVSGTLPPPDACHCTQCRKQSGHFFVSTDVPRSAVTIHGEDKLTWYRSSEKVRRGFCSTCGSSLFWDPIHKDWIGIAMGAFDQPTGTRLRIHIHVADKGDYYDIADGRHGRASTHGSGGSDQKEGDDSHHGGDAEERSASSGKEPLAHGGRLTAELLPGPPAAAAP